ncbi:hypothetical protein GMD88_02505 [Pseudoflavonifractor sp. BIOML-A6]|nr:MULTISPECIES: hypothetical protein [unclassified Pseudoflavonifractor]MTQ95621.1 hypothetical protein [Pseudoflavonifractor sp. BIOML-A16]MTR05501.1 hypothetical protein [Pseudoflavonifractor sp. BIOML-A15]MTR74786.1 hypothetical protein [Pseudoflavonifractor sp. BIOML-A18]MTS64903.1 hypothetical protein [Pseudoflavonifractor sp. BIOML-A5]MTS71927.1 hypothetical protein [Pseudoflavonifractor sp. BIOML-A8]MTS92911.1 hypothetical protein [Pseudoflavonifractor sp. BIOML-A4]
MSFSNLNAPSSALRVCVDHAGGGYLSGLVYSQRVTEPIPFTDIGNLLLRLDEVLEAQNFPQAFQRSRNFTGRKDPVPAAADPSEGMSADTVTDAHGLVYTFEVSVTSRRNASWQGMVDWLDGEGRQEFSSALELIKLIEEHVI